ncbi:hypothetical protein GCM10011380_06630 [Sphingomonas metalli]|uniref:PIN domain-containing protein n=1 Tax=Sphingomonas metalli TaxID=1779358 RepID=A0A916SYV4_9SPHN|nr:type II toxin-antitoxin system VapC family toxin [Sphingomonas metalli]GGB19736.1 hypothetical protein GCM10011380_06630 [Sphingomonas metalli]
MKAIIDASVLLAYLLGEPGQEVLAHEPGPFLLSSVNLAEVLTRLIDRGLDPEDITQVLKDLPVEHVVHDRADARLAAELRPATRSHGLSLGDRACLALGRRHKLPVLTADTQWAKIDLGIDVRLIR